MPQESRPTTQQGRDVISSLMGSIKKSNINDSRRRFSYGKLTVDGRGASDDDGGGGDDVEENFQEQEMKQISYDAEDYRNFSIDEYDCNCNADDNGIDISNSDEELPQSILQHPSQSLSQSSPPSPSRRIPFPNDDLNQNHNHIYHHCHSQIPIPPQNYICPLTLQLMEHPVQDGCGHIFERRAIFEWLETKSNDRQKTICPISRKPIIQLYRQFDFDNTAEIGNRKYDHVLRNDPDLQQRILEWKLNYPMYQGVDADYVKHQREVMLYHDKHPYGYDQNSNCDGDNDSSSFNNSHDRLSRFELILLPQERQILKIVKTQACLRQERIHRSKRFCNCMVASAVAVTVLLIASYVVLRNRNGGLGAE